MALTQNEIMVLDYLLGSTIYKSAGVIGSCAGGLKYGCGTWAVEACESLFKQGLLERSYNGWYRPKQK